MAKIHPKPVDVSDPVAFITAFLRHPNGDPVVPHEAQQAIIYAFAGNSHYVDVVVEAGRQLGKSLGLAWLICWYLVYFPHRQVYVVAPSLDQARIIYNEVVRQFTSTGLRVLMVGKPVDFPFPHLKLQNHSELHGRGANSPKYLRGKPVHLLIEDEAAYFKEGIHPSTIEPMFTVTSKEDYTGIIRISTPFGEGDFWEGVESAKREEELAAIENRTPDARYLHFSSYDNPFANEKMLNRVRERYGADSLLWRTEYMAESVGNELSVFPSQDVKWAYEAYPFVTEHGTIQYPRPAVLGHSYVQGVDLANQKDYFVSTILDNTDALLVQVHHDRAQHRGYAYYKSVVRSNYAQFHHAKTLIDATSLGESVVEELEDIGAEGYKFSGTAAKYDLVHGLVRALSEHRVALPFVRELIDELRNFQYEMKAGHSLKMEARTGHDDYVMSLALAVERASHPHKTGFFMGTFGPIFNRDAVEEEGEVHA